MTRYWSLNTDHSCALLTAPGTPASTLSILLKDSRDFWFPHFLQVLNTPKQIHCFRANQTLISRLGSTIGPSKWLLSGPLYVFVVELIYDGDVTNTSGALWKRSGVDSFSRLATKRIRESKLCDSSAETRNGKDESASYSVFDTPDVADGCDQRCLNFIFDLGLARLETDRTIRCISQLRWNNI